MVNLIKKSIMYMLGIISFHLVTTQLVIADEPSSMAQPCTHDDLCPDDNKVICSSDFPKIIILGNSQRYERVGGPRTCSFQGRRTISYSCTGDGIGSTVEIASLNDRRRISHPVLCDGFSRAFAEYAGNPPYHIHWHLNKDWLNRYNRWNSAQIIIH